MNLTNNLDQSLFPIGVEETTACDMVKNSRIGDFSTLENSDTVWLSYDIDHSHTDEQEVRNWSPFGAPSANSTDLTIPNFGSWCKLIFVTFNIIMND